VTRVITFDGAPLTDREAAALAGEAPGAGHYDEVLADGDADVYGEGGGPLCLVRRGALAPGVCAVARPALRRAARGTSSNRRSAPEAARGRGGRGGTARVYHPPGATDGVVGFWERTARRPYGHATRFTRDDSVGWRAVRHLLRAMDAVYQAALPEVHGRQTRYARMTSADFVIPGTCFTTATVNRNLPFAFHRDQGNLHLGFGVMAVLRSGRYEGCLFVLPQYRIAVDLQDRDVILFDSQCWHGNTPFAGAGGAYERLSVVAYYRAKMIHCGTAAEENQRAKRHQPGDPLY
jgi:hypothetical protein